MLYKMYTRNLINQYMPDIYHLQPGDLTHRGTRIPCKLTIYWGNTWKISISLSKSSRFGCFSSVSLIFKNFFSPVPRVPPPLVVKAVVTEDDRSEP